MYRLDATAEEAVANSEDGAVGIMGTHEREEILCTLTHRRNGLGIIRNANLGHSIDNRVIDMLNIQFPDDMNTSASA